MTPRLIQNTNRHNKAKKINNNATNVAKMGKNMCEFMSSPKEIEHSSEKKVIFIFLDFFLFTLFFQFLLYIV
jgi:hypothetical protein